MGDGGNDDNGEVRDERWRLLKARGLTTNLGESAKQPKSALLSLMTLVLFV